MTKVLRRRIFWAFVWVYFKYKINVNFYAGNVFSALRKTTFRLFCLDFYGAIAVKNTNENLHVVLGDLFDTFFFAGSFYDPMHLLQIQKERCTAQ